MEGLEEGEIIFGKNVPQLCDSLAVGGVCRAVLSRSSLGPEDPLKHTV